MKSRGCFRSEAELCYYSDGEIYGPRGITLDNHIIVCWQCSIRLLIWNEIKALVYSSYSHVDAPDYMKASISLLIEAESNKNESGHFENTGGNTVRRVASSPRDRYSLPGFIGIPFSPPKTSPGNLFKRRSSDNNSHFDN
jgi:hypothetical protein